MTFVYKSEPVRGAVWQRMFAEPLADLPVRVWPDTEDKRSRFWVSWPR